MFYAVMLYNILLSVVLKEFGILYGLKIWRTERYIWVWQKKILLNQK